MDAFAQKKARQANRPEGVIYLSDAGENPWITIWAMEWGQVIRESRARHKFFHESLEYEADRGSALRYLHETHKDLLQGVITGDAVTSNESEESDHEQSDGL
ncbi:MAG: hypothetical protein HQL99_06135 [Magnetococcales bacterium]|nr:hypothetical protein [Magnetococcales bacterium]